MHKSRESHPWRPQGFRFGRIPGYGPQEDRTLQMFPGPQFHHRRTLFPQNPTSCTQSSERTEPVLIPLTHHYIVGFSFSSGHSLATCTDHYEEHLHTVYTVPEKIGMGLLNRGRAIRICTQHLPDHLIMTYCLYGGYIS